MSGTDSHGQWAPSVRDTIFVVLAGVFITNALLGELAGGKLIFVGGWVMSVGVLPWPIVFITTDLVNEYYGPKAVRRLTWLAVALIVYAFLILQLCISIPAWERSPVGDPAFSQVFAQSQWIIVGSLVAFAISQLLDAGLFVVLRRWTSGRLLWLRALGSTVVSQLIDTFVINSIAFGLPGKITPAEVVSLSVSNYVYKFLIALATVPIIYLGHAVVDRLLDRDRDRAG